VGSCHAPVRRVAGLLAPTPDALTPGDPDPERGRRVVCAAAGIAFNAAGGAYLKALLPPQDLLTANGRFEATSWSATMLGRPLGGAAVGWFGLVVTVTADAVSHLLSGPPVTEPGRHRVTGKSAVSSGPGQAASRRVGAASAGRWAIAHRIVDVSPDPAQRTPVLSSTGRRGRCRGSRAHGGSRATALAASTA
jgi:hypothetical protein